MANSDFEKTSWGWQWLQLQQQVGEWVEFQFSKFMRNIPQPDWSLPVWLMQSLKVISIVVAGLLLLWLGWRLWRWLEPYLYSFISQTSKVTSRSSAPSTSELSVEGWLKRSRLYLNRGDYREACRCLYMAAIQILHDREIVRHQPSRTDGEYWQLVQQLPQSQSYRTLIATHEQLCFGNRDISLETFDRCQQAYQEITRGNTER